MSRHREFTAREMILLFLSTGAIGFLMLVVFVVSNVVYASFSNELKAPDCALYWEMREIEKSVGLYEEVSGNQYNFFRRRLANTLPKLERYWRAEIASGKCEQQWVAEYRKWREKAEEWQVEAERWRVFDALQKWDKVECKEGEEDCKVECKEGEEDCVDDY